MLPAPDRLGFLAALGKGHEHSSGQEESRSRDSTENHPHDGVIEVRAEDTRSQEPGKGTAQEQCQGQSGNLPWSDIGEVAGEDDAGDETDCPQSWVDDHATDQRHRKGDDQREGEWL